MIHHLGQRGRGIPERRPFSDKPLPVHPVPFDPFGGFLILLERWRHPDETPGILGIGYSLGHVAHVLMILLPKLS